MKEHIRRRIDQAVRSLYGIDPPPYKVEKPRDEKLGDLATNVSFLLAKELRRNPADIARELAEALAGEEFREVTPLKGFVNFRFSEDFLLREFGKLLRLDEEFFREDLGKGERIQIEFVSANPTGPLHLGHGRGAVVGDALARLLTFFGYRVTREYYINDAGRQVYLLGVSVLHRYLQLFGQEQEEIREIFEREGYRGDYVVEIALLLREAVGDLLLNPDGTADAKERLLRRNFPFPLRYTRSLAPRRDPRVELCAAFGLDVMMEEIRRDLSRMNIDFDVWFSERSLYERGLVEELIDLLRDRGFVYESEGALWLKTSQFGDDKDRVLRKSDGSYTYFASDIAYHWDKFRRGFDRVVDLWGADHHGYIPRVRASLKMLGVPEDWLEVYLIQMVKLFRGGKEVRMSKRAGEFVTLRELVEEVGQDAVRFVFLTKRSDTPLDFDVDRVKEKSSENPVFYVQYAHARIAGVFREFRERYGRDPESLDFSPFLKHLRVESEIKLVGKTLMMKDELVEITLSRDPHLITYYLVDLAGTFHAYYNHHRIVTTDEKVTFSRLGLLKGIRSALRLGLKLIGVSAPEKM